GGGRLPAEVNLDPGDQFPDKEGLNDIVIGTQLQPHDAIGLRRARGQEDHRGGRKLRMRTDGLADFESIGIRKHDVENDEVWFFAPAKIDGALAGFGASQGEAFLLQVVLDQRKKIRVILDKYNLLHSLIPK